MAPMPTVKVRFFDDETLEGTVSNLSFDEADFLLQVEDPSGLDNNEMAWIPLSAVKWVDLPDRNLGEGAAVRRKVAVRFLDGEVLRGFVEGELERHRFGLVTDLHPENATTDARPRRLGIPFSAIKALFYVREFDGRAPDERGSSESYVATTTMAPLLGVLEEMDMLARLREGGVLSDDEYHAKRTQILERM